MIIKVHFLSKTKGKVKKTCFAFFRRMIVVFTN